MVVVVNEAKKMSSRNGRGNDHVMIIAIIREDLGLLAFLFVSCHPLA